jgi:large subunit ribosomal protein L23
MDYRTVIKRPLVTEKASIAKEANNKYCFAVGRNATKGQIKEAVQALFKVEVEDVHTSTVHGKLRRLGAHSGFQPDWKKAIVKVKKGQEIKMVEEV